MDNKLTYTKVGDYYIPDLTAEPMPSRDLGKYGRIGQYPYDSLACLCIRCFDMRHLESWFISLSSGM